MKPFTFLGFALLLSLISFDAYGQVSKCPPPTNSPSVSTGLIGGTNNRTVPFSLTGSSNCALTFYLFDDGYFSYQRNPVHEFRISGTYDPGVYALEEYDGSTPAKTAISPVVLSSTTGSPTSRQYMGGQSVRIGQSWRAADDNQMIYIVSLVHPGGVFGSAPLHGSVTLELDKSISAVQFSPNTLPRLSTPPGDWGTPPIFTGKTPSQGDRVTWQFNDLLPGASDVINLYLLVDIPRGMTKNSIVSDVAVNYSNDSSTQTSVITASKRSRVFTYPHDPNTIEVNKNCALANGENQVLEYTVNFQNEGNGFANTVQVRVDPSWQLMPETVRILDASHRDIAQVEIDPNGSMYFTFQSINLPGTKQTYPNTYTYDQTTGFVKFAICTLESLPEGMIGGNPDNEIGAEADIFFDNQPPVWAGRSMILPKEICNEYEVCDLGEEVFLRSNNANNTVGTIRDQVKEAFDQKINIYPNPTQNQVNIEYAVNDVQGANVNIVVRGLSGQHMGTILSDDFKPRGEYKLGYDLSSFPAGIYLVEIQTGKHQEIRRIVKMD